MMTALLAKTTGHCLNLRSRRECRLVFAGPGRLHMVEVVHICLRSRNEVEKRGSAPDRLGAL